MLNTREGLSDPGDFEAPFRDKLTDLEGVPPQDSWAAIQTALDQDRGVDRRWYLLLLLLLVGSGGFIGGYWVSQVRQARQMALVNERGERFKIQEPKTQNFDGGDTQLFEDCDEVCEDDAESGVAGTAPTGINKQGSVHEDESRATPDVEVNRRLMTKQGERSNRHERDLEFLKNEPMVYGVKRGAPPAVRAAHGNNQFLVSQHPDDGDGHDVIAADQSKTPVPVGNGDSAEINGPMPYPHPHYGSVNGVSVAGVDSVQSVNELAVKPVSEETDSTEEKKKKAEPGKWTLQVSAGGNYVFKKLTPSEDLFYITDLANKNKFSWRNAGYHLAARIRREVGARTTLMAGVSWSRWQTYIGYKYYDVVADSVEVQQITSNSMEVKTFFAKHTGEIRSTVQQVGLSVGVLQKVNVLQREHKVLLEANLYQKIYATIQSGEPGHRVSIHPMSFAIKAGVEKNVDIGAWHFTVTPYVQRYLGSVYTSESVFQFSPLQVGLDVGLLLPLLKK